MPTLSHPNTHLPGTPRIRIDVPDGWEQLDVPQTLLAARELAPPDDSFATNVVVRHLVRPGDVTELILVDELVEVTSSKDHGQTSDPYEQLINGQPVHGVNLSYVDPAAGTLGQIHFFARRLDADQSSIVQLVMSFSGARAAELRPVLKGIGLSLKIDWPAS